MSKPALKQVEELFHQAVVLSPELRHAFLDETCAGNAELRAAVETLLRHDADNTDIFQAGPMARHAQEARLNAPTLPAAITGHGAALPEIPEYEMVRQLGRGGMGTVYLARHVPLKRLVALKMLMAGPATAEQLARFRIEAEALARLQHPNVVPIYDIGQFQGHPYFTMEYIAGSSLADMLDGRPQDVASSARLVEVLARAVDVVHQCGLIHRDIKPANILFQTTEHTEDTERRLSVSSVCSAVSWIPKISDFGLAKDLTSPHRVTQAGVIMGTPCYMAPEQVRNREGSIRPAADTYALGSVLYELLTGRPAFDAATPIEIIAQLLHEEPLSPARLRPRLPPDIVTICLKCLEKSPHRRYASACDLAEDLRRFQAHEPIKARPVGPVGRACRWCLRKPLVAGLFGLSAALAIAFIGAVMGYEIVLARKEAALEQAVVSERLQIAQLNVIVGQRELDEGDVIRALLRFTEALALESDNETRSREYRSRIAAALRDCPRLRQFRESKGPVVCANIGPMGAWVATAIDEHTLEVSDAWTGHTIGPTLKTPETPRDGAFSAGGKYLAIISAKREVRVWDMATRESRLLPVPGKAAIVRIGFMAGTHTLVIQDADFAVRLCDLTSDSFAPPPGPVEENATHFALSDDAQGLFTVDNARRGQVWDMATGKAVGQAWTLDKEVHVATVSRDGRLVALVDPHGTLRIRDVIAGAWLHDPIRVGPGIEQLAFSPDGARVLTAGSDGAQVWHPGLDKAVTPRLCHGHAIAAVARSSDGTQVITVCRDGTTWVWDMPPAPDPLAADDAPVDQLQALARLLACAEIGEDQQLRDLDNAGLRAAWEKLQQAH
jgi:WD40 repeat protein